MHSVAGSRLITIGASVFLPSIILLVIPINLISLNYLEINYKKDILTGFFFPSFMVFSALLVPIFLLAWRRHVFAFVARGLITLGISIFLWDFILATTDGLHVPTIALAILDMCALFITILCISLIDMTKLLIIVSTASIILTSSAGYKSYLLYTRGQGEVRLGNIEIRTPVRSAAKPPAKVKVKGNVYEIILDAFQGEMYQYLISQGMMDEISGFTYFPNFYTNANRTHWSNSISVRGSLIDGFSRQSPPEWMVASFQDGIFANMFSAGVNLYLYPHYGYYCSGSAVLCKPTLVRMKIENYKMIMDLWFLKLLPGTVRRVLDSRRQGVGQEVDGKDWNYGFSITRRVLGTSGVNPKHVPVFSIDNFMEMLDDESERPPSGQYVFSHVIVPHGPAILDGSCNYLRSEPAPSEQFDRIVQHHECGIHLISLLVKRLRKLNRLEDSLIIVHSDHGMWAHPADLRKIKNDARHGANVRHVLLNEEDSSKWPSEVIETIADGLLLVKLPGSKTTKTSEKMVQSVDIGPTIADYFGLPRTSYAGLPIHHIHTQEVRKIVFYATNSKPSNLWPEVFSEYVLRDGVWSFRRNIETRPKDIAFIGDQ